MTSEPYELSCQELVELVTDYLEDALRPELKAQFEEHVAGCADCATYLEQMRTTVELVGRLEPSDVPPEAESALLAAFRDWKRR